jgi:hypothetical protein
MGILHSSIPVQLIIDKGSGRPLFHSREGGNPVNNMILKGMWLISTMHYSPMIFFNLVLLMMG